MAHLRFLRGRSFCGYLRGNLPCAPGFVAHGQTAALAISDHNRCLAASTALEGDFEDVQGLAFLGGWRKAVLLAGIDGDTVDEEGIGRQVSRRLAEVDVGV